MNKTGSFVTWAMAGLIFCLDAADVPSRELVLEAMKKGGMFYRESAANRGGYVYYYSPDFARRLAEGEATATEIWVQPPGTPSVGLAYLDAWQASKDAVFLEAARDAAKALLHGQLKSGGWRNSIDFAPSGPRTDLYRNGKGNSKGKNQSTLDDGITQTALLFLIRLDEVESFQDRQLHEAVLFGLQSLLKAQFPNGSFPQVWSEAARRDLPEVKASLPDYDWRTENRIKEYWDLYTLNDNLASEVTTTLIEAARVYQDPVYFQSLKRLGDFLILAQLPEPQPAWAQQYDYAMRPVWARKFEPPAVAGSESQSVIETLIRMASATKDRNYLSPLPSSMNYLEKSLLPDGRLARYYELKTNRPLFMERNGKEYFLTFSDAHLPSHYGWKTPSRLAELKAAVQAVSAGKPFPSSPPPTPGKIAKILAAQDSEGRWMSYYQGENLTGQPKFQPNEPYLSSAVFVENLNSLSQYLHEIAQP